MTIYEGDLVQISEPSRPAVAGLSSVISITLTRGEIVRRLDVRANDAAYLRALARELHDAGAELNAFLDDQEAAAVEQADAAWMDYAAQVRHDYAASR